MKKILLTLLSLVVILMPSQVYATASSVDRITDHIEPLNKTDYIRAPYYNASSTTATSTFNGNLVVGSGSNKLSFDSVNGKLIVSTGSDGAQIRGGGLSVGTVGPTFPTKLDINGGAAIGTCVSGTAVSDGLSVCGDINFTGGLYQSGVPFASGNSAWTIVPGYIYNATSTDDIYMGDTETPSVYVSAASKSISVGYASAVTGAKILTSNTIGTFSIGGAVINQVLDTGIGSGYTAGDGIVWVFRAYKNKPTGGKILSTDYSQTSVIVANNADSFDLTWDTVPDADGYIVQRTLNGTDYYKDFGSDVSYTDTNEVGFWTAGTISSLYGFNVNSQTYYNYGTSTAIYDVIDQDGGAKFHNASVDGTLNVVGAITNTVGDLTFQSADGTTRAYMSNTGGLQFLIPNETRNILTFGVDGGGLGDIMKFGYSGITGGLKWDFWNNSHGVKRTLTMFNSGGLYLTNADTPDTAPSYLLDVNGDVNVVGALRMSGSAGTTGQVLKSNGSSNPTWVSTSTLGFAAFGSGNTAFTIGNGFIFNATSSNPVGIGTSTPFATLSVKGSSTAGTRDLFAVASSSDAQVFNIKSTGRVGVGSSTPAATFAVTSLANVIPMSIASSTNAKLFTVDGAGHLITGGQTPSVSTCGTSPTISGNDTAGTITVGTGVVTACTVTFAVPRTNTPRVVGLVPNSAVAVGVSAKSTSSFTITFAASVGGGTVDYLIVE